MTTYLLEDALPAGPIPEAVPLLVRGGSYGAVAIDTRAGSLRSIEVTENEHPAFRLAAGGHHVLSEISRDERNELSEADAERILQTWTPLSQEPYPHLYRQVDVGTRVRDLAANERSMLPFEPAHHDAVSHQLDWSPAHDRLVAAPKVLIPLGGRNRATRLTIQTLAPDRTTRASWGPVFSSFANSDIQHGVNLRISPDGSQVLASLLNLSDEPVSPRGRGKEVIDLFVLDTATMSVTRHLPGGRVAGTNPWSPDGTKILLHRTDTDGRLVGYAVHDLRDASTTLLDLSTPSAAAVDRNRPPHLMGWTSDSEVLLFTRRGEHLTISAHHLDTGQRRVVLRLRGEPTLTAIMAPGMPPGYWDHPLLP